MMDESGSQVSFVTDEDTVPTASRVSDGTSQLSFITPNVPHSVASSGGDVVVYGRRQSTASMSAASSSGVHSSTTASSAAGSSSLTPWHEVNVAGLYQQKNEDAGLSSQVANTSSLGTSPFKASNWDDMSTNQLRKNARGLLESSAQPVVDNSEGRTHNSSHDINTELSSQVIQHEEDEGNGDDDAKTELASLCTMDTNTFRKLREQHRMGIKNNNGIINTGINSDFRRTSTASSSSNKQQQQQGQGYASDTTEITRNSYFFKDTASAGTGGSEGEGKQSLAYNMGRKQGGGGFLYSRTITRQRRSNHAPQSDGDVQSQSSSTQNSHTIASHSLNTKTHHSSDTEVTRNAKDMILPSRMKTSILQKQQPPHQSVHHAHYPTKAHGSDNDTRNQSQQHHGAASVYSGIYSEQTGKYTADRLGEEDYDNYHDIESQSRNSTTNKSYASHTTASSGSITFMGNILRYHLRSLTPPKRGKRSSKYSSRHPWQITALFGMGLVLMGKVGVIVRQLHAIEGNSEMIVDGLSDGPSERKVVAERELEKVIDNMLEDSNDEGRGEKKGDHEYAGVFLEKGGDELEYANTAAQNYLSASSSAAAAILEKKKALPPYPQQNQPDLTILPQNPHLASYFLQQQKGVNVDPSLIAKYGFEAVSDISDNMNGQQQQGLQQVKLSGQGYEQQQQQQLDQSQMQDWLSQPPQGRETIPQDSSLSEEHQADPSLAKYEAELHNAINTLTVQQQQPSDWLSQPPQGQEDISQDYSGGHRADPSLSKYSYEAESNAINTLMAQQQQPSDWLSQPPQGQEDIPQDYSGGHRADPSLAKYGYEAEPNAINTLMAQQQQHSDADLLMAKYGFEPNTDQQIQQELEQQDPSLKYVDPNSPSEFYFRKSVEQLTGDGEWMHEDSKEGEEEQESNADDDDGIDPSGFVSPEHQFQKMMKEQMKQFPKSKMNTPQEKSGPKLPFVPPRSSLLSKEQQESLLAALGNHGPERLPNYHIPEVAPLPLSKYKMPDHQEFFLTATSQGELEGVQQQQQGAGLRSSAAGVDSTRGLPVESQQQQHPQHPQQSYNRMYDRISSQNKFNQYQQQPQVPIVSQSVQQRQDFDQRMYQGGNLNSQPVQYQQVGQGSYQGSNLNQYQQQQQQVDQNGYQGRNFNQHQQQPQLTVDSSQRVYPHQSVNQHQSESLSQQPHDQGSYRGNILDQYQEHPIQQQHPESLSRQPQEQQHHSYSSVQQQTPMTGQASFAEQPHQGGNVASDPNVSAGSSSAINREPGIDLLSQDPLHNDSRHFRQKAPMHLFAEKKKEAHRDEPSYNSANYVPFRMNVGS